MIRRPPRSTLFPTRRSSDLQRCAALGLAEDEIRQVRAQRAVHLRHALQHGRSEEHTSELQSPCNLVCRLLLEKKKKYHLTRAHSQSELFHDKYLVDRQVCMS